MIEIIMHISKVINSCVNLDQLEVTEKWAFTVLNNYVNFKDIDLDVPHTIFYLINQKKLEMGK